jgi:hypothetical protein
MVCIMRESSQLNAANKTRTPANNLSTRGPHTSAVLLINLELGLNACDAFPGREVAA